MRVTNRSTKKRRGERGQCVSACLAGGRTLVAANEDVSSSHFVVHDRGILTTRVCCCYAVQSPGGRMGREGRGVVRVRYRRDWGRLNWIQVGLLDSTPLTI